MTGDGSDVPPPHRHEPPATELTLPPPRVNTVLAVLAVVLLLGVAVAADTTGRALVLPALVPAVGWVLRDLFGGPIVRADAEGVELLDGLRRVRAPWSEVERVRVVRDRRTRVLEVDLGEVVVALSGTRLGRDPADVQDDLLRCRPVD